MNARTDPGSGAGGRGRCPVCGRPSDLATRPFCSVRCADVDLGRWLTGQYRVPTAVTDEGTDEAPPAEPDPA
ncbi:MAG TPA: DNA gyrase inhibitor YacG [Acetobacteraceae bacterium]|jgi:uncharacterized protein|nr:DNA gyrase inhibitor YacG [Acetobacteraceae bacterium]